MSDLGSPSSRDAEDSALSYPDKSVPESPESTQHSKDDFENDDIQSPEGDFPQSPDVQNSNDSFMNKLSPDEATEDSILSTNQSTQQEPASPSDKRDTSAPASPAGNDDLSAPESPAEKPQSAPGSPEEPSASAEATKVIPADSLDNADGHVELDYGDDEIDLNEPTHKLKTSNAVDGGDSEEEGEIDSESEGEIKDEEPSLKPQEMEDGEIDDGRKYTHRTQLCRFFTRGSCTWGYSCRFLHPGINDKGNYQLIDRPGMKPPPGTYNPEQPEENKEGVDSAAEEEKSESEPEAPSKPETPWERGLRQAKEALKRASRKREMEIDIEEKKMNLTLDNTKKPDHRQGDPYYDCLEYDELDPIQVQSFEDHSQEDTWDKLGFEETYEDDWIPGPPHPPLPMEHAFPPNPYERGWRDDRAYMERERPPVRGPPGRGPRQHPRSPNRNHRERDSRGRMDGKRGVSRQAYASDTWIDPWQRNRPNERRKPRRRSSSGSSSFSSLSRSSRDSSQSSFSSRSRTRTPTPLRNVVKPNPRQNLPPQQKNRDDDRRPPPPRRPGPEWPASGPPRRRSSLSERAPPREDEPESAGSNRLSRKDQKPRKDKNKFKRRGGSVSSSSSSSSSSDSSSDSSRSRSSSSDSSSSSGSSSSSSSSSSDSASDSDDLYAGIDDKLDKPKKKRSKKHNDADFDRHKGKPKHPEKLKKTVEQKPSATARETTTTSKAGIKLTLVNKSKVQNKKRVLESPPPEPEPPTKKSTMSSVDKDKSGGQGGNQPSKAKNPTSPVKASNKQKMAAGAGKNKREELLKQLKAVEDAIAKKRSTTK